MSTPASPFALTIEEARKIEDRHLRFLTLADKIWKSSDFMERRHKYEFAEELDSFDLMSLQQLAKVTRTTVPSLVNRLPKRPRRGGRFAPETLRSLVVLRRQYVAGQTLSPSVVESVMQEGTSGTAAARLIGSSTWSFYNGRKKS